MKLVKLLSVSMLKTTDFDYAINNNGGTVTLNNETKDIKFGENEITFTNVPKDQELDLIFKGNYDLDTNTISEETNKNYYTDTEIYKTTYALYDSNKYDNIKLTNIKTNSDNNDNYFEKTEPINLLI